MIEKRLVQWYAADAGVDLDVAEREIVLTYVLRILADTSLLEQLAFKGGTAIRKLYLGHQGRFSLDLDFTVTQEIDPESFVLDVVGVLNDQAHHGLSFTVPARDYYANPESCGAEVTYQHAWATAGRFGIQVSFRGMPLLPVRPTPLRQERYFDWLEVEPPAVPALDQHEIIAEKIRAAAQRSRVRDLYDLYQLGQYRFDRALVRRLAVLKCWETHWAFDPAAFLAGIPDGRYDWLDLRRLVRRGGTTDPAEIIRGVQLHYGFPTDLTDDEERLRRNAYGREKPTYRRLADSLESGLA